MGRGGLNFSFDLSKIVATPVNDDHTISFWFQFIQRDGFVSEEICCFTLRPRIRFVSTLVFILIHPFYNTKFS